ncbi:hypothetical protein [Corallococcus sp. CA049B]|uniref:hypothetical protein n=1 Tax=Corallococcus sp. CA049B TaxID=2316730 RepID=UPI001F35D143|nr:hypothetical protein [Corallococcus sp. CA049B]
MNLAQAVELLRSRGIEVRYMGGADSMIMCRYRHPATGNYVAFALCKRRETWTFSHMGPGQMMTERPVADMEELVRLALECVSIARAED